MSETLTFSDRTRILMQEMVTAELVAAAEAFKTRPGTEQWTRLVEAMFVYQQWEQALRCTDRISLLTKLVNTPMPLWQDTLMQMLGHGATVRAACEKLSARW